jgi:HEAT repeat protein
MQPLIAALRDEDRSVRIRAAGALGRIGSGDAVGPLADALDDHDSSVRLRAAQALEEIGTPAARAALEQKEERSGRE